ncbi:hypothetical protein CC2G_002354 [Coprinopsis cinerea AmutBmut pab1-1]|nr:hypothetical protein CC2G_002354 [Coprinopsis cinerea AmutBmut pab1-1]
MQNGVAMRPFQLAALKFSVKGNLPRNIYIDGVQCYIGKPESKQHFRQARHYDAYWLLEDRVGLALVLYLGIFRPLEFSQATGSTGSSILDTLAVSPHELYPYFFLRIIPSEGMKQPRSHSKTHLTITFTLTARRMPSAGDEDNWR